MESNKPSIKFNLPEGWKVDFRKESVDTEELGDIVYERYILTPCDNDLFERIGILKDISGYENGGVDDRIEYYAETYLDSLNLPYSIRPDLDHFICSCDLVGETAYYIVRQQPRELGAEVLIVFYDPRLPRDTIEISAFIKDWDEGQGVYKCIDFLSNLLLFD